MEILYDSGSIHTAIKQVLTQPGKVHRRVVLVAYVGDSAERFLPHPQGLHIVCCLQSGATSARALERLRRRGAKLFHCPSLHMKVYWSSRNGCVITSANASASALARNGLKEAGVFFERGIVDIDRLLRIAKAKPILKADMLKLHVETNRLAAPRRRSSTHTRAEQFTFDDWFNAQGPQPWKIGWWADSGEVGSNTKREAKTRFGVSEVYDFVNCANGQYQRYDWILCFRLEAGRNSPSWLYVDFVAKVNPADGKDVYESDFPFQAVQVNLDASYPSPPFIVNSSRFRHALSLAIDEFGEVALMRLRSMTVPRRFRDLLIKHWNTQA